MFKWWGWLLKNESWDEYDYGCVLMFNFYKYDGLDCCECFVWFEWLCKSWVF